MRIEELAAKAAWESFGSRSCWARSSRPKAGTPRLSISIPPRANTWCATWSALRKRAGSSFACPILFRRIASYAARLALVGLEEGWGPAFVKGVYRAEFAGGCDISAAKTLTAELEAAGAPVESALARARSPAIKARLRANTEEAQAAGIFGAPSFTTNSGELFWGDDRLEQAVVCSLR